MTVLILSEAKSGVKRLRQSAVHTLARSKMITRLLVWCCSMQAELAQATADVAAAQHKSEQIAAQLQDAAHSHSAAVAALEVSASTCALPVVSVLAFARSVRIQEKNTCCITSF